MGRNSCVVEGNHPLAVAAPGMFDGIVRMKYAAPNVTSLM